MVLAYPKPSPALAELLRWTAEHRVDDLKLLPVPPELYVEANTFIRTKHGQAFTRESMMLNGHLITPKAPGERGFTPAKIWEADSVIEGTVSEQPKAIEHKP